MFALKKFNKNFKIFSNIQKHLNLSHKFIFPIMEADNHKQPNGSTDLFRGVPETLRFKPIQEFSLRDILRVQAIHNNPEKYYETTQVVCGWSRTIRFTKQYILPILN